MKVGTFNLNNLFSRFNFQAEIDEVLENRPGAVGEVRYEFDAGSLVKTREYMGQLVKGKKLSEVSKVAECIKWMDLDVLGVQEVEDIDTLKEFNKDNLGDGDKGMYRHLVLIEGNDNRMIDVALLSKYPLGRIVSWQTAVHPSDGERRVFGRDLLQVDVLSMDRSEVLFTLFNNHLKSNYVGWDEADKDAAAKANHARRKKQAEVIKDIVRGQMADDSKYVILGDMNDVPGSGNLKPFIDGLKLVDGLKNATETNDAPDSSKYPPPHKLWTHRHLSDGKATFSLYDQIWVSEALKDKVSDPKIKRRKTWTTSGSDHDPAYLTLNL
jgi:endonuclease/exonuclease/phosphatase family metal-dependent hydrolase